MREQTSKDQLTDAPEGRRLIPKTRRRPNAGLSTLEKNMPQSIERRLVVLLAEHLDIAHDLFTREATLTGDLGMDSFDIVENTMEIEDEFEIHVPADAMEEWRTFGEILDFVTAESREA